MNVNDKGFRDFSMPIHNPPYEPTEMHFRGDIFNVVYKVKKPDIIAGIVPSPLVYMGEGVRVVLNVIKELKAGFPKSVSVWNEISIQIPVIYEGQPADYIGEVYSSDMRSIMFDREVFGLPRLPGRVTAERDENGIKAKLTDFYNGKEMVALNFQFLNRPPQGPPSIKRRKVFLKYIPSSDLTNAADVKKLLEMKYGRPAVQKMLTGSGSIELLESAPTYLKEAGMGEVTEALYIDIELDCVGATVIHNYKEVGYAGSHTGNEG